MNGQGRKWQEEGLRDNKGSYRGKREEGFNNASENDRG